MSEVRDTEWLYANALNQKYIVYGSFYNIINNDASITKCRNALEIYNRQGDFDSTLQLQPFSYRPDAIFIMMNPGSSSPKDKNWEPLDYDIDQMGEMALSNCLVKAKPDVTQYQVMRVMNYKNWGHVRVLNLSDIREPKSKVFFKKCADYGTEENIHSIFSDKRINELKAAINVDIAAPIILAWGNDLQLIQLSKGCLNQLKLIKNRRISVRKDTMSETLCYHASPTLDRQKRVWFTEICSRI
jgi:hypothetical protein